MARLGPSTVVWAVAATALLAAISLCPLDLHDDPASLHGCLPPVAAPAGVAVLLLTASATAIWLVPAPGGSVLLDPSAPPPKLHRSA